MSDKEHAARVRRLAELIVVDLFIGGAGSRADRLVLVTDEDTPLGGWCPEGVRDRIEKLLLGIDPPQNSWAPPKPTPEEFFAGTQIGRRPAGGTRR